MRAFESELPAGVAGEVQRRYFVEARYAHQVWDLSIGLEGEGIEDEQALERLLESFHDAHERIFAVREPGQRIEMSQWKGRVIADTAKPPLDTAARRPGDPTGDSPLARLRLAFFPELGEVEIPVHLGGQLAHGTTVAGPALVIEPETTIVVYPGWSAHVSPLGNYKLELA
jgi:N-methylhydantoinase A